ncbi:hypothetical protein [Nocardioides sp. URHA0032]|uniref:hypothetical protein n=1 Tax=Nocardioides sp. URHA0032 TaxID=1380388 RepID=UPI00048E5FD0|nr:hypothetical protein [Nocardioides sp. URHA0032]
MIVSGLPERGVGWVVGGGGGALWLVVLVGLYETDARSDTGGISSAWFAWWFALATAACLVAVVLTTRRSTRLLGQGMLLGLTTLFLVGVAVVFLQAVLTPS